MKDMKEWKIGEIRCINGEWYQCVECSRYDSCKDCAFCDGVNCNRPISTIRCMDSHRLDDKNAIFKKLEKVGEPIQGKSGIYQVYKLVNSLYGDIPDDVVGFTNYEVNIRIKETKEDMEEKERYKQTPLQKLTEMYTKGQISYNDFEEEIKELYTNEKESKLTLKEFDLEAAKAGKLVCTRNRRKARIICFDAKGVLPIIALVESGDEEKTVRYSNSGRFRFDGMPDEEDLMMLSEKKKGWVNVYRGDVYKSEEEAKENGDSGYCEYIKTIEVEWEE